MTTQCLASTGSNLLAVLGIGFVLAIVGFLFLRTAKGRARRSGERSPKKQNPPAFAEGFQIAAPANRPTQGLYFRSLEVRANDSVATMAERP